MSFTDLFIRRPVLAWVVSIIITLLGLVAYKQLPLRQYPQVETPVVTVETGIRGASAEVIEAQITRLLEDGLAGMDGVEYMISSSESERSKVKLFFRDGMSSDVAAANVRDRLGRVELPPDVQPPRLYKADSDGSPTISLVLHGSIFDMTRLYEYAEKYIKNELGAIPGVASVTLDGGSNREMLLRLNLEAMNALQISAHDIEQALHHQSIKRPGGRIVEGLVEYSILTDNELKTEEDFNNLVVGTSKPQENLIRIKDIGQAVLQSGDERHFVRFNGNPAIVLHVIAQSRGNPIEISQLIEKKLETMRQDLPQGMLLDVAADRAIFIKHSIDHVYQAILEAVILVIVVIFLFLGSLRASLIPLVTIPVSLIGSCFIMYCLGFSLNTLTLLSMVLAIGLVVDDAIVVLENIYRYLEQGMAPLKAAIRGTREISFSVICMTFTLIAVYAPIALAKGTTGKVFTEFALTLAGSVLISGIVALTLSPMMCSRILQGHSPTHKTHGFSLKSWIDRILSFLEQAYANLLSRLVIPGRWITLFLALCLGVLGFLLMTQWLPKELSPRADQGYMQTMSSAPVGSTMGYLNRCALDTEQLLMNKSRFPEIKDVLSTIQVAGETYAYITLQPWEKRSIKAKDLAKKISDTLRTEVMGFQTGVWAPSSSILSSGSDKQSLSLVLQSDKSIDEMVPVASSIIHDVLRKHPGVVNDPSHNPWDISAATTRYQITFDRDRALALGVDPYQGAHALEVLISKKKIGQFERDNKLYSVRAFIDESQLKGIDDLKQIRLKSHFRDGPESDTPAFVPIGELIKIEKKSSRPSIPRFEGLRAVTLSMDLQSGYSLEKVYKEIKAEASRLLPDGFRITESGSLRKIFNEGQSIVMIFALAVLFIYLILSAQFESFVDPLIIILSVPLALTGALVTLWFVPEGTVNVYSQIGLVTLIGLITKHGILMIDFANHARSEGSIKPLAIIEASKLRLRPILMTTFAMVLGAVPLALATGADCEARRQIGWVIVGGMSLGTLFTLFVIPAAYVCFSPERQWNLDKDFEDHI